MTYVWRMMMILLCALAVACGDGTGSDDDDGGDGDGDTGGPALSSVECGGETCQTVQGDADWGAVACCFDEGAGTCGVKSDAPAIVDLGLGLGSLPLTMAIDLLAGFDPAIEASIVERNPTVSCMPKDQPGEPSDECPGRDLMAPPMDEDAGMTGPTVDLGDAGMGMMVSIAGCCRPDGMCGYIDDTGTIGGCVKISESLVGKIFGDEDQTCTP